MPIERHVEKIRAKVPQGASPEVMQKVLNRMEELAPGQSCSDAPAATAVIPGAGAIAGALGGSPMMAGPLGANPMAAAAAAAN